MNIPLVRKCLLDAKMFMEPYILVFPATVTSNCKEIDMALLELEDIELAEEKKWIETSVERPKRNDQYLCYIAEFNIELLLYFNGRFYSWDAHRQEEDYFYDKKVTRYMLPPEGNI